MNLSVATYGYELTFLLWKVIFLWFILWCSQYLDHILLSGMMIGEKWIRKDFEDPVMTNQGIILTFVWQNWGKQEKP